MTQLSTTMSAILDRGETVSLTAPEEAELVLRVREAADSAALADLLRAYAPTIRAHVRRYRNTVSRDDAEAIVAAAVLEAVHQNRPGERLAARLPQIVRHGLDEHYAGASGWVSVPTRTLQRFYQVMAAAGHDERAAAALAPTFGLAEDAFHAVAAALQTRNGERSELDPERDGDSRDDVADADTRRMAAQAIAALSPEERDICRLAFGLDGGSERSDGEVAELLGIHRKKVQRARTAALVKMRGALGFA